MKKHLLVLLPWLLTCFGAALNVLVITANGGLMPVIIPASWAGYGSPAGTLMDQVHITWYAGVHLKFLADWIQVPWAGACSPGDLCIWAGEWIAPYGIGAWLALCWRERSTKTSFVAR